MEYWNGLFTGHGLKINLEKTEVLHIGHQREELYIKLEGKKRLLFKFTIVITPVIVQLLSVKKTDLMRKRKCLKGSNFYIIQEAIVEMYIEGRKSKPELKVAQGSQFKKAAKGS